MQSFLILDQGQVTTTSENIAYMVISPLGSDIVLWLPLMTSESKDTSDPSGWGRKKSTWISCDVTDDLLGCIPSCKLLFLPVEEVGGGGHETYWPQMTSNSSLLYKFTIKKVISWGLGRGKGASSTLLTFGDLKLSLLAVELVWPLKASNNLWWSMLFSGPYRDGWERTTSNTSRGCVETGDSCSMTREDKPRYIQAFRFT